MQHPARFLRLLALLALAIPLSACTSPSSWNPWAPDEEAEERKRVAEEISKIRRALEPGETVIFEFEGDGFWHPSPIAAYSGHELRIRPARDALHLPDNSLEFKIGKLPQHITKTSSFRVTQPGALLFRLDEAKVGSGFNGQVAAEITRMK